MSGALLTLRWPCYNCNSIFYHLDVFLLIFKSIFQVNLSPGLVEANVGEPHLLRGKNWSEREEVRIIVTIVMTIFKRGGEDHRDNYDDNCQKRRWGSSWQLWWQFSREEVREDDRDNYDDMMTREEMRMMVYHQWQIWQSSWWWQSWGPNVDKEKVMQEKMMTKGPIDRLI